MADRRQRQTLAPAGAAQEGVGKLDQDAGTVALQRVGARRAAMGQILEDREPLRDDRVGLATFDVGDESQATRVALVRRIVETLPRRRQMPLIYGSYFHVDLVDAE